MSYNKTGEIKYMPQLTVSTANVSGVELAQPKRSMRNTFIRKIENQEQRGLLVPFTPVDFNGPGMGGNRVGNQATEIPFLFFSHPNCVDTSRFYSGGNVGNSGRHNKLKSPYVSVNKRAEGGGQYEELVLNGLLGSGEKLEPMNDGLPGVTGTAIAQNLMNRISGLQEVTQAKGLKGFKGMSRAGSRKNLLNDEAFSGAMKMIGVSSDAAMLKFMELIESMATSASVMDSRALKISLKSSTITTMVRNYARMKQAMARWEPGISAEQLVLFGGNSKVRSSKKNSNKPIWVGPSKYVELKKPFGGPASNNRQNTAEMEINAQGMMRRNKARAIAPAYNVLWQLALSINQCFDKEYRMSTPDLMGELMAVILGYTEKIGLDAVFGTVPDHELSNYAEFDRVADQVKPFLGLPWSAAFDDMDPATFIPKGLPPMAFQELLFCFNVVLADVVVNVGIPTIPVEMIMPVASVPKMDRILQDAQVNQRPDIANGASTLPFKILTPTLISNFVTARNYTAWCIGETTWGSDYNDGRPQSVRLAAETNPCKWYGTRDHRMMEDVVRMNIVNGHPTEPIEARYAEALVTVTRDAMITSHKTQYAEFNVIHLPRSRLSFSSVGDANPENIPAVKKTIEQKFGERGKYSPDSLTTVAMGVQISDLMLTARGLLGAYTLDAASAPDQFLLTSPTTLSSPTTIEFTDPLSGSQQYMDPLTYALASEPIAEMLNKHADMTQNISMGDTRSILVAPSGRLVDSVTVSATNMVANETVGANSRIADEQNLITQAKTDTAPATPENSELDKLIPQTDPLMPTFGEIPQEKAATDEQLDGSEV